MHRQDNKMKKKNRNTTSSENIETQIEKSKKGTKQIQNT